MLVLIICGVSGLLVFFFLRFILNLYKVGPWKKFFIITLYFLLFALFARYYIKGARSEENKKNEEQAEQESATKQMKAKQDEQLNIGIEQLPDGTIILPAGRKWYFTVPNGARYDFYNEVPGSCPIMSAYEEQLDKNTGKYSCWHSCASVSFKIKITEDYQSYQ